MLTRVLVVVGERGHIVFIGRVGAAKLSCSLSGSSFCRLRMSKGKREREQEAGRIRRSFVVGEMSLENGIDRSG